MAGPQKKPLRKQDQDFLDVMGQALDEYDQEKAAPKPLARVFRNDPTALRGLETADVYPDRTVYGRRPDTDRAALEGEGYEWRPVDEYATVAANPQLPVAPPKGKLPFISNTPTHPGKPIDAAELENAVLGSRKLGPAPEPKPAVRNLGETAPIPVVVPKRPEVQVSTVGPAPALRPYQDIAPPASGLTKVAERSPLVAQALARKMEAPVDELAQARQQANANTFNTRLARAGAMVNEALSGARYDRGAYDDLEAEAQQPLTDMQLRRQMGFEDTAEARAQAANARAEAANARDAQEAQQKGDLYDPASQRSQSARALLLLRHPDKAKLIQPGQLARMSAADVVDYIQGFDADAAAAAAERRHQEDLRARAADRAEARAARLDQRGAAEAERNQRFQERMDQQRQQQEDANLQKLGKAEADAPTMARDMETVNRFIEAGGDLPGVGPIVGRLPEFFISAEGTELRGAAERLVQNLVYAKSGKSITPEEARRVMASRGMGPGQSETAFIKGMASIANEARDHLRDVEANYSPAVVQRREQQGGITSAQFPGPAQVATGERITMPNGEVYEVLENGDTRRIR